MLRDASAEASAADVLDARPTDVSAPPLARVEATASCALVDGSPSAWAFFDVSLPTDTVPDVRATVCGVSGAQPTGGEFAGLNCYMSPRIDFGGGRVAVACFGFEEDPTAVARISYDSRE